jgi:hypothetical protein
VQAWAMCRPTARDFDKSCTNTAILCLFTKYGQMPSCPVSCS